MGNSGEVKPRELFLLAKGYVRGVLRDLKLLNEKLRMDMALNTVSPFVEVMIKELKQVSEELSSSRHVIIDSIKELMGRKPIPHAALMTLGNMAIEMRQRKGGPEVTVYFDDVYDDVTIPNLSVDEEVLRAMRAGWRMASPGESLELRTTHAWQVITWSILFPGAKAHLCTEGVRIRNGKARVIWHVEIKDFPTEWLSSTDAAKYITKLGNKDLFLLSLFSAMINDNPMEEDEDNA